MRIGVVFPQTEIGPDRAAVQAYAESVTELGFAHILAYDHVVGADPDVHQGWSGPYNMQSIFHEPFVLFGYLAALTPLELVTGILILPQRQTTLVAKQAAEVDILTGGRLRLGIGIGWNAVEYEALGKEFRTRGARTGPQIELLRRLWTETSVTYDGRYEKVTGAGLAPLPLQRPIPIWVGGQSPPAYRRVGQYADGWFPQVRPGPELDDALAIIADSAAAAGRDPSKIGMEGRAHYYDDGVDGALAQIERWRQTGATHLSINTMRAGLQGVDAHLQVLARLAEDIDFSG